MFDSIAAWRFAGQHLELPASIDISSGAGAIAELHFEHPHNPATPS